MNHLVELISPISINYESTLLCNLRCGFCFSNSATKKHANPPISHVFRVIDAIADAEVFELRWFGGEFLALNHWQDAVDHASKRGLFMSFVSNGTVLDKKATRFLASYGIDGGALSIHGTESNHDMIVGVPGSFKKAVRAIENCAEENIGITVLFTPTKNTVSDLFNMAAWFKANRLPIDEISVGRLCPSVELGEDWDDMRLSLSDYVSLFETLRNIREETGIRAAMGDAFPLCKIPKKYWDLVTGCWQGTGFAHISYTGNIKGCSIATGYYGNILEIPLKEIWSNPDLRAMRKLEYLPSRCRICPFFCGGGCSASRPGSYNYGVDEFLPAKETIKSFMEVVPLFSLSWARSAVDAVVKLGRRKDSEAICLPTTKPAIGSVYRIRKEKEGYLGFFKSAGVLTFDESALMVVSLLDGTHTVEEIINIICSQTKTRREEVVRGVNTFIHSINHNNFLLWK